MTSGCGGGQGLFNKVYAGSRLLDVDSVVKRIFQRPKNRISYCAFRAVGLSRDGANCIARMIVVVNGSCRSSLSSVLLSSNSKALPRVGDGEV